MEYILEENANGKKVPKKVGMAAVQREGIEYEFDVAAELRSDGNELVIIKTRCEELSEKTFKKAGDDIGKILAAWLSSGSPPAPPKTEVIKQLIDDVDVNELFNKLGTAPAKRQALCEKYGNKESLVAAMNDRIAEKAAAPTA